jgi:TonB family protein
MSLWRIPVNVTPKINPAYNRVYQNQKEPRGSRPRLFSEYEQQRSARVSFGRSKLVCQKRAEARLSIGDRTGAQEDQRKVAQLDPTAQGQGVYRVGNGISPPVVLYKVDPTYTEEARRARYSGTVVLQLIVDPGGFPRDFKVVRSLGMGLDDKAIEAVRKWKFRPGHKNGQAVAAQATIEVNFRLFNDATK